MIVILVLAHQTNLEDYKWLGELSNDSEVRIYCHIDKKTKIPLTKLKKAYPNVRFEQSVPVYWAHRSMVDATNFLITLALANEANLEYALLVSNDSRPIQDINDLKTYVYSRGNDIEIIKNDHYFHRMTKYNFLRGNNYSKHPIIRALSKLLRVLQYGIHRNNWIKGGLKGSQWWLLDRRNLRESVRLYFYHEAHLGFTSCVDEHFYQNVFASNMGGKIKGNYRLMGCVFDDPNSPKVLGEDEITAMKKQKYQFARKIQ